MAETLKRQTITANEPIALPKEPQQNTQTHESHEEVEGKSWRDVIIGVSVVVILMLVGGCWWWKRNHNAEIEYVGVQPNNMSYVENAETHTAIAEDNSETIERIYPSGASGNCDHDGKVYYTPNNLIDGDIRTCWALDIRGKQNYNEQGFGDVRIKLSCKRLDYIVIYNGYQKNNTTFNGNPRAKTIAIYNVNDMSTPILNANLEDTENAQTVSAINNIANNGLSEIAIFFPNDFYYPAQWNDLSISEIEFYGVK